MLGTADHVAIFAASMPVAMRDDEPQDDFILHWIESPLAKRETLALEDASHNSSINTLPYHGKERPREGEERPVFLRYHESTSAEVRSVLKP